MTTPYGVIHVSGVRVDDLDHAIQQSIRKHRALGSNIVCCVDERLLDALQQSTADRARILNRTRNRRLLLCSLVAHQGDRSGSAGIYRFHSIEATGVRLALERDVDVARVRRDDLLSQFQDHELSAWKLSDDWHFRTPSGAHADRFLRVADLLLTHEQIMAWAFWLCDHVHGASAILLDTWAIAAPVLMADRMVAWKRLSIPQVDATTGIEFAAQPSPSPIDALTGHPSDPRFQVSPVLRRLTSTLPPGGRIVVVQSVASSGALIEAVSSAAAALKLSANIDVVNLVSFQGAKATGHTLLQIPFAANNHNPIDCDVCGEGRFLTVDASLYYIGKVERRPADFSKFALSERCDPRAVDTLFSAPDAVRYHVTTQHRVHYETFIDLELLLSDVTIVRKWRENLRNLKPPTVILVCGERPTAAKLAHALYPTSLVLPVSPRSRQNVRADLSILAGCDTSVVWVVSDVEYFRLQGCKELNAFIRESVQTPPEEVHFIVGVGRPHSIPEWERAKRSLTNYHTGRRVSTFNALVEICLRDPGEPGIGPCAWCDEQAALRLVPPPIDARESEVRRRLIELANPKGLTDSTLWQMNDSPLLPLAGESLLGPAGLQPHLVLLVVLDLLNRFRQCPQGPGPRFPISYHLTASALAHFNEPTIRAALLRSVGRLEWHPDQRRELCEVVLGSLSDPRYEGIAPEVAVATSAGGLSTFLSIESQSIKDALRSELSAVVPLRP